MPGAHVSAVTRVGRHGHPAGLWTRIRKPVGLTGVQAVPGIAVELRDVNRCGGPIPGILPMPGARASVGTGPGRGYVVLVAMRTTGLGLPR